MRDNLSGYSRVHARVLGVDTDVSVVKINLLSATQVCDTYDVFCMDDDGNDD